LDWESIVGLSNARTPPTTRVEIGKKKDEKPPLGDNYITVKTAREETVAIPVKQRSAEKKRHVDVTEGTQGKCCKRTPTAKKTNLSREKTQLNSCM